LKTLTVNFHARKREIGKMSKYKIGDVTKFLREKLTGGAITDGTPTTDENLKKLGSKKRRRTQNDVSKLDGTDASVGEDALVHFSSTKSPDKHDDAAEPKRKRRKVWC